MVEAGFRVAAKPTVVVVPLPLRRAAFKPSMCRMNFQRSRSSGRSAARAFSRSSLTAISSLNCNGFREDLAFRRNGSLRGPNLVDKGAVAARIGSVLIGGKVAHADLDQLIQRAASLAGWLGGGVQPANRGRLGMFSTPVGQ